MFKDLPLTEIHPQAATAAEAARCAGAQDGDAFVAMHDMLFDQQKAWSGKASADDLFAGYAEEIGVDKGEFISCLENGDFEAAVQADILEANEIGFGGTHAFRINGQPLMGAQPFEVFQQAVDNLVA